MAWPPDLLEETSHAVCIDTRLLFGDPHFLLEWVEQRSQSAHYYYQGYLQGFMACSIDGLALAQYFFNNIDNHLQFPYFDIDVIFQSDPLVRKSPQVRPTIPQLDFFHPFRDGSVWRPIFDHPSFSRAYKFRIHMEEGNTWSMSQHRFLQPFRQVNAARRRTEHRVGKLLLTNPNAYDRHSALSTADRDLLLSIPNVPMTGRILGSNLRSIHLL
jgi:hypothetical protein